MVKNPEKIREERPEEGEKFEDLETGDLAIIKRTSGAVENDWEISKIEENEVTVIKKEKEKTLEKTIPREEFSALNSKENREILDIMFEDTKTARSEARILGKERPEDKIQSIIENFATGNFEEARDYFSEKAKEMVRVKPEEKIDDWDKFLQEQRTYVPELAEIDEAEKAIQKNKKDLEEYRARMIKEHLPPSAIKPFESVLTESYKHKENLLEALNNPKVRHSPELQRFRDISKLVAFRNRLEKRISKK